MHDTPAGAYPSEGPQPSKWPVLNVFCFYGLHFNSHQLTAIVGAFLLPLCDPLHHWGYLTWQMRVDPGDYQSPSFPADHCIISHNHQHDYHETKGTL